MPLRPLPKDFQEPPALPLRGGLSLELDVSVVTTLYGGGAEAGSIALYFRAGEWLSVGSGTSMGMGKYRMETSA